MAHHQALVLVTLYNYPTATWAYPYHGVSIIFSLKLHVATKVIREKLECKTEYCRTMLHLAPSISPPITQSASFKEFDKYEAAFDSTDASKRLPHFILICLGENHTQGMRVGGANTTSSGGK